MAYFAELDADNIVLRVISVSNENCPDPAPDNEQQGIEYLASLGLGSNWKQTSYHGTFRKNYAGIGFTYDEDRDAFIAPQPYPSWLLDEDKCIWYPPIPYPPPLPGSWYYWNEPTQNWVYVNDPPTEESE